jgi:alkylhydroperoxidase/carboxymuconolactone decarboxylase family protein YurZ
MKIVQATKASALAHVPFAKKIGATHEEIRETVVLALTAVGLKGIITTLSSALEIYDKV